MSVFLNRRPHFWFSKKEITHYAIKPWDFDVILHFRISFIFNQRIQYMKRINEYKKLFQIENEIDLAALKLTYRKLVKQWHPDKFQDEDPLKEEARIMGRQVVDGYHFLVSIAPETKALNLPEYQTTIATCGIADYKHKGLLLEITFTDGSTYEYFGVNANVFKKLINSDKQVRFAKRFIYDSYLYRKSKKATQEEA